MFTVWYFDGEFPTDAPDFIYSGTSEADVYKSLCVRFGQYMIDGSELDSLFATPGGGFIIELPGDSRVAVIKH